MISSMRNPATYFFLIVVAILQAFIQGAIFWHLGDKKFGPDYSENVKIFTNITGMAFMVAMD